MFRVSRTRLVMVVGGIVVLAASATGAALAMTHRPSSATPAISAGYPGASRAPGAATGYALSAVGQAPAARASMAYPQWCCSNGSPLGLTVTGQATVDGASATARNRAIARAVADAETQARTAASAAGVSLGKIINMQVSVPYYPYPVPMEGAAKAGGTARSPAPPPNGAAGSGGSSIYCAGDAACPVYPAISMTATVTITWAIS